MTFSFRGTVGGSKSLFIRALVAASYHPSLEIVGTADSADVTAATSGLQALAAGEPADCSDGGAVLRFLALRASRLVGEHVLVGSDRLFSRPISELRQVVESLGAFTELGRRRLVIRSDGWAASQVAVDCRRSSQFASGVLVNAWGLESPLTIELQGMRHSRGYWDMTQGLVGRLGMEVTGDGDVVTVPAGQEITADRFEVELDMGSAFAVAAVAAVSGEATIEGFPTDSLQPDARFPGLLADMGAEVEVGGGELRVARRPLRGLAVDLGGAPDLFPVLAALAATADGGSDLGGAPQLRHKESDRIAKVGELVSGMGRAVEVRDDGLTIGSDRRAAAPFTFDADHDHRMAMAAAVARCAGAPVTITGGDTVDKSFGRFWDIVGWRP